VKVGDIVLVKGTGIVGAVIDGFEHSIYGHTAGLVKDGVLIEANGFKKTGYTGLLEYKGRADVFTCDSLTDKQREEIAEYVRSQVGTSYDWLLLFLEGIRYAFHVMLPHKEYHNHICSTLWNDAYRSAGIDLCPGIKYPSPGDLAQSKLLRKVQTL
jgi:hypothetical protein